MSQEQFVAELVGLLIAALVVGWRASVWEAARAEPEDADDLPDTDLAVPEPVTIESDPQ